MGAIHNELRKRPFSEALTRALGAMDAEVGLERFGETLQPVVDLWRQPEWRYLRGERTTQASNTVAAGGAGVRSRWGIQNPTGSRLLTVVEYVLNNAAVTLIAFAVGTGLTVDSFVPMRPTDTRWYTPTTGSGVSQVTVRQGAIGGTTTTIGSLNLLQGVLYPLDIILRPGQHLSADPSADNLAISLWARVRERLLLPGEDTTTPQ